VSFQYKRWMRAVDGLKRIALSEKENLPRKMSIDYIDLIRLNIFTGKYSSTYARYSERYRKWKYMVFKSTGGFWQLRNELVMSLQSKRKTSTKYIGRWFGGIPSNARDTGGVSWLGKGDKGRPLSIALYANWMEYGRSGQPARPLFRPTLIEYAEKKATVRLGQSRRLLMGRWQ